jgi:hypothetical protein
MSSFQSMSLAIRVSSSQLPPLPLPAASVLLVHLPLPDLVHLPLPDLAHLPPLDLLALPALPLPLATGPLIPTAADATLAPCPAPPMAEALPVVLTPSAASATNIPLQEILAAALVPLAAPGPLLVLLRLPLLDLDFPLLLAPTN